MKALTFAASSVAASALIVGGFVAPAQAADATVAGYINVSSTAVGVSAYKTAPVSVSTNVLYPGYSTYFDATVVHSGATFPNTLAGNTDTSGNGLIDLIDVISWAEFNGRDVPAGNYTVTLHADQESYYGADDSYTTITAANSAPITVKVSKLHTTITGWKTKSKSAKYKKRVKLSSPTVKNGGLGTKVIFQYKKKGSKTWKTSESGTLGYSSATSYKIKTQAFNLVHNKLAKKGTYYFRFKVVGNGFVTGAVTKQVKVTWK